MLSPQSRGGPVPASPGPGRPSHWPAVHKVWDARRTRLKRTVGLGGTMWPAQADPFVRTTSGGCPETVSLNEERDGTRTNQVNPSPVPLSLARTTGAMLADTLGPGASPSVCVRRCSAL